MDNIAVQDWFLECQAKDLIKKMEKRGFKAFYAPTAADAKEKVLSLLPPEGTVALVGSQTLNQTGINEHLREVGRDLVDPFTQMEGLSPRETHLYYCRTFTAAAMLTSTNAMDSEGRLYNIDGLGNRVAAMAFGPELVIVVVSMSKLASTQEEAWRRARQVASPMNNKRLEYPNPCTQTGHCHDCQLPSSICNYFSIIDRSRPEGRIQVVLVGEDLGY